MKPIVLFPPTIKQSQFHWLKVISLLCLLCVLAFFLGDWVYQLWLRGLYD